MLSNDYKIIKFAAKVILCDIEGTTTSINFVKNVLFPFSRNNVKEYLTTNWKHQQIQKIVAEIIDLMSSNNKKYSNAPEIIVQSTITDHKENSDEALIESMSNLIQYFIDNDYKISPLKSLQGLIWENGYKEYKFKGHVFDDVPKAMEKWFKSGLDIYIYSSGSVKAQKLLFEYSDYGNLLKFIKGHFDTAVGYKQENQSYENILKELKSGKANGDGSSKDETIFFTDIPNEAYAAKDAGITCILLDRPGNGELSKEDRNAFPVIQSFDQIEIECSSYLRH